MAAAMGVSPVGREEADRASPSLGRLDALRDDRVEHLLRRESLGQPGGDRLQAVRARRGGLRLVLHVPAALEELRDENGDGEEERHARRLVAVRRYELVPRRREEEVEAEGGEQRRDETRCEAAQVRGERDGEQEQEAGELGARPVREQVGQRDKCGREDRGRPAESSRRPHLR
jgi:hypothetical protein